MASVGFAPFHAGFSVAELTFRAMRLIFERILITPMTFIADVLVAFAHAAFGAMAPQNSDGQIFNAIMAKIAIFTPLRPKLVRHNVTAANPDDIVAVCAVLNIVYTILTKDMQIRKMYRMPGYVNIIFIVMCASVIRQTAVAAQIAVAVVVVTIQTEQRIAKRTFCRVNFIASATLVAMIILIAIKTVIAFRRKVILDHVGCNTFMICCVRKLPLIRGSTVFTFQFDHAVGEF